MRKSAHNLVKQWLTLQLPDRGSSGSDSKKKKLLGDPLNDIKRYLDLEEIRCNSRKGRHEGIEDKIKYTQSEENEVRRACKKSKKKTNKCKSKKRTKRSSSSGSDTSTEVSKLSYQIIWCLG
jgi:hypothetical protein